VLLIVVGSVAAAHGHIATAEYLPFSAHIATAGKQQHVDKCQT
jgi:hypothetical protein